MRQQKRATCELFADTGESFDVEPARMSALRRRLVRRPPLVDVVDPIDWDETDVEAAVSDATSSELDGYEGEASGPESSGPWSSTSACASGSSAASAWNCVIVFDSSAPGAHAADYAGQCFGSRSEGCLFRRPFGAEPQVGSVPLHIEEATTRGWHALVARCLPILQEDCQRWWQNKNALAWPGGPEQ